MQFELRLAGRTFVRTKRKQGDRNLRLVNSIIVYLFIDASSRCEWIFAKNQFYYQ